MPLYECISCNFSTKLKGNYSQHIKTKKHQLNITNQTNICNNTNNYCSNMVSNPNESFLNHFESSKNHFESSLNHFESSLNPNESLLNPNESFNKKNNKKFICEFCKSSYSTSSNLHRHLKKCKKENDQKLLFTIKEIEENHKKELKKQQEKISAMEKEKEVMKSHIEILLNKVGDTTNITNNTIVLNCYGSENLKHISDSFKTDLLKIPYAMIPKLIEATHFNKDCPENKNICLPNKKAPYVKVYENESWIYKDKKETIKELVDKNYSILDAHYESKNYNLDEIHKERYVEFQDKMKNKDSGIDKKVNQDIELMLINN